MWVIALFILAGSWIVLFAIIDNRIDIKPRSQNTQSDSINQSVSIVIAFRNEEKNLINCLSALDRSKDLHTPLEVCLVNDHSEDKSVELIESHATQFNRLSIRLISSKGTGKKSALLEGLNYVNSDWIYFTDADCMVGDTTIFSLLNSAIRQSKRVVFGPVSYSFWNHWTRFAAYENYNTQAFSEAFLNYGYPLLVNGGNMLVSSTVIEKYKKSQQLDYASGDDVFFALSLDRDDYSGVYTREAVVTSSPPSDFRSLISQRLRWTSKASAYVGAVIKAIPAVLWLHNTLFVVVLVAWILSGKFFNAYFILLLIKWAVEFTFHARWFSKYGFKTRFIDSFVMTLIYPLYFFTVGILANLDITYGWKGRRIKSQRFA